MSRPNPATYTITLDDDPMVPKIIERLTLMTSLPFTTGKGIISKASSYSPVAVFVDVHLQVDESGIDFIPELRKTWPHVPILVITSDDSPDLVGHALAAGANDFVRKPLGVEFVSRLQARIVEMRERMELGILTVGDVTFDYKNHYLDVKNQRTYLSPIESEILRALVEAGSMIIPKKVLKRKIWKKISVSDNALDRRLSDLRKTLKSATQSIEIDSTYGVGVSLRIL